MIPHVHMEERPGFGTEVQQPAGELRTILGLTDLKALCIVNRCDVEGTSQELLDRTIPTAFSEP